VIGFACHSDAAADGRIPLREANRAAHNTD
jgi:hypothetical protein